MKKRTKISIFFIFVIFAAMYIGLWLYSAQWFKQEIDTLYANAKEQGIEFLGEKPHLTNFPLIPTVVYTGGIKTGNIELLFPRMILRGYPVPFTTLHLDFPEGISIGGIVDPEIWSLESLQARLGIPYHLPRSLSYDDLKNWEEHDGKIDVRKYTLQKGHLLSEGNGLLTLDQELQPVISVESTIRGYEEFIREQQQAGLIEPFPAAVGIGMLGSLAKTDEATGVQVVHLNASVKNRILTVGPLQVLELPLIAWDRHTQPAPHQ